MVEIASLRLQVDSRDAKRSLDDYTKSTTTATRGTSKLRRESDDLDTSLVRTGRTAQQTRRLIGGIFAGLTAAGVARSAFQSIADFETGLVGVGKTADISGQNLLDFGDEVIDLRQKLGGVSTLRLLELSEAAGQLGIKGRDNLLAFSEALARVEVSSDVAGAEGAKSIARILGLTTDGIGNVERFASSLVALGNDAKAGEAEILSIATTLGQVLGQFDASGSQVLAFATTFKELGLESELTSGALGRLFAEVVTATSKGGIALETFAQLSGQTSAEFVQAFEVDSVQAIRSVLEAFNRLQKVSGPGATLAVLDTIGVESSRDLNRVLTPLIKNIDLLGKNFAIVDAESRLFAEGSREQSALYQESSKALATLSREVVDLVQSFGDLVRGQDGVRESTKGFIGDLADAVKILGGKEADEFSESAQDIASALDTATDVAKAFVAVKIGSFLGSVAIRFADAAKAARSASQAFDSRLISSSLKTQTAELVNFERNFRSIGRGSAREIARLERNFLLLGSSGSKSLNSIRRSAVGARAALSSLGVGAISGVTFAFQAASVAALVFGEDIVRALSGGSEELDRLKGEVDALSDSLFKLNNAFEPDVQNVRDFEQALKRIRLEAIRLQDEAEGPLPIDSFGLPPEFEAKFKTDLVAGILAASDGAEDAAKRLAEVFQLNVPRETITDEILRVQQGLPGSIGELVRRSIADAGGALKDIDPVDIAKLVSIGDGRQSDFVAFIERQISDAKSRIELGLKDLDRGFFRIDPETGEIIDAVQEIANAANDASGKVDALGKSTADLVPPALTANVDAFIDALNAEAEQAAKTDVELLRLQTRKDVLAALVADGVKVTEDDTKATEAQADAVERARIATDRLIAAKDQQSVDEYVRALQEEVNILRLEERGLKDQAELLALQSTLLDKSGEAFDANRERILALLAERRKLEGSEDLNLDFSVEITPLDDATQALQSLRSQVDGIRFEGDEAARIMAQVAENANDIDPEKAAALARILGEIRATQEELRTLQGRDLIDNVEAEVELLGKTEAQRRTALELTRLQIDAESDLGQSIEATFERLELAERVREGASGAAGAFGNFLRDARDGVDDLGDALEGLATDVIGELTDAFVIDPLVAQLQASLESIGAGVFGITLPLQVGSATAAGTLTAAGVAVAASMVAGAQQAAIILAGGSESDIISDVVAAIPLVGSPPATNAKGGIAPFADGSTFMDSQTVTAFRRGGGLAGATRGIVNSPTLFPLGLAGEAGPEAILPLLQDGRLPILGSDISLALKRDSAGVLRAAFDDPRAFAIGESFTTAIAPSVEFSAIAPPSDRAGRSLSPSVEMDTLQRQLDGLARRLEQVAKATQKSVVPRDRRALTDRQAESDRARNRSFTRGRL